MRTAPWLSIALALCTAVFALPARGAVEREEPRTISVNGNSEVRADPDRAHATFGIQAQASTAQEAQAQANRVIQRVMESLRRLNIPPRNIQTSGLTLQPVFEPRPPTPREEVRAPRIVAYIASNVLTVLVERVDQVGGVIDAAMAGGANTIQGVRFSLADDQPQRTEALRAAGLEARQKAEAIAAALGVRLGPLRTANEGNVQVIPVFASARGRFAEAAAPDAGTPVAGGQVTIQASISVVYDIATR
jgi:uncharacterized protein YggE